MDEKQRKKLQGLLRSLFLSEVHVRNASQFPRRAYRASEVNRQLWCETVIITATQPPSQVQDERKCKNAELQRQRPQEKQPQKDPFQAKWPGTKNQDENTKAKEMKSRPNPRGQMTTQKSAKARAGNTKAEMQVRTYIPSHLTRGGGRG